MKTSHMKLSRRSFLLAATAGTAATAAALIASKEGQPPPPREQVGAPKSGYQLTDHVRNYYRTAGI